MSFPIHEALTLIHSTFLLLEEHGEFLVSPEDAAYFRAFVAKKKTEVSSPPQYSKPTSQPKQIPKTPEKRAAPIFCPEGGTQIQSQIPKPWRSPPVPYKNTWLSDFYTIFTKIAPGLPILSDIPNDERARKIAFHWKTKNQSAPISILVGSEHAEHRVFLEAVKTALDVYFGPAKCIDAETIEKEKQWDSFLSATGLKLIIICDSTLWQLHHLRQFYKEVPASKTRVLQDIPLFLLPDLSLYLKDPPLKRSLWKALCQKCL